jgi:hypothetical protein
MATIAWPDDLIRPTSAVVWIETASMVIPAQRRRVAPVVYETPDAAWRVEQTFGLIAASKVLLFKAFLDSLLGPVNTALVPDWDYDRKCLDFGYPGGATGTITATGAKDASTVALAGVGGVLPSFRAGGRLAFGGFVYHVTADTDRAGSAIAALPVRPRLRADASAAAVTLTALRLPVRLVDDQQTRVNQHPSGSADAGPIGWVEVVP